MLTKNAANFESQKATILIVQIALLLLFLQHKSYGRENSDTIPEPQQNTDEINFSPKTDFTLSLINSLGSEVIESRHDEFMLYYKRGSYSQQNLIVLLSMVDEAILRVKNLLGKKHLKEGFYLVMVESREEMNKVIGWNVKGLASGRNDAAIFVYNEKIRPYFRHELFHLILFNIWGESKSRLLDEGGAMYSDNQCLKYKNPLSAINKYLHENGKWFDIDELINNFNDKARENDLIAYLQAGFIFRHLYENYGRKKLKTLWKEGFTSFKQIYGFDVKELATKIKSDLNKIKSTRVDWNELMDKGCC